MNMETVEQFRTWIGEQIDLLADSESFNETDWIHATRLIGQAREYAFQLRLPDVAVVARRGPVRQRLCEVFNALPEPDYLTLNDVAAKLGISPKTVRRRILDGSIPEPQRIGNKLRWLRGDFS
jgi:predicted DNA-binding transcriptional regulator AlpA